MHTKLVTLVLGSLAYLSQPTDAAALPPSLVKRGSINASDVAQLIKPILEWFGLAFPEAYQTWDYGSDGRMCAISMRTIDGGNCQASVTCNDGVTNDYNDWNSCYVGGRQYFTDDRIGDFSITFTQQDGEGEGLTNAMLSLANVDNWKDFDVANLAQYYQDWNVDCNKGIAPLTCDNTGPFICYYATGNSYITDARDKKWICGMPRTGLGGGGIDSNAPVNDAGYLPGWCGVHVTQYQKAVPGVDPYGFDVKVYDANENEIGSSGGTISSFDPVSVTSLLPNTLTVSTGELDTDPVYFQYADQSWAYADVAHSCNFGAFDSGKREGDCGFTC